MMAGWAWFVMGVVFGLLFVVMFCAMVLRERGFCLVCDRDARAGR